MAECPAGPESQASRHPGTRRPSRGALSRPASEGILPRTGAGRAEPHGGPQQPKQPVGSGALAEAQSPQGGALVPTLEEGTAQEAQRPRGPAGTKPDNSSRNQYQGPGPSTLAQFPQVPMGGSPTSGYQLCQGFVPRHPHRVGGGCWHPVSPLSPTEGRLLTLASHPDAGPSPSVPLPGHTSQGWDKGLTCPCHRARTQLGGDEHPHLKPDLGRWWQWAGEGEEH